MSSRINTANALMTSASSAFHALSSQCIQYASLLDERDQEIEELKTILWRDSGCEENARLVKVNKELKVKLDTMRDNGRKELRAWENQTEELLGMNKSLDEENQKLKEEIQKIVDGDCSQEFLESSVRTKIDTLKAELCLAQIENKRLKEQLKEPKELFLYKAKVKELREEINTLKEEKQRDTIKEVRSARDKAMNELKELKEQLEPLQDAMDGWTGVCNFEDVVEYVDNVREDGEEQVENLRDVINQVRDDLEGHIPNGKDGIFIVPKVKDISEYIQYIDNHQ